MSSLEGLKIVVISLTIYSVPLGLCLTEAKKTDSGNSMRRPIGDPASSILTQLPPCEMEGNEIKNRNSSCVFIASSIDASGDHSANSGAGRTDKNASSATRRPSPSDGHMKNSGRGNGGKSAPYDKEGRYWLVPPFLIGASSVIVLYVLIHCFYMHCYAKRKMRQLASRAAQPHIIFDADGPSSSSIPMTPVVKYEDAFGKTGMVEAQPFLLYHSYDGLGPQKATAPQEQERRKSMHLQLPSFLSRKGRPRASVCSASAAMETTSSGENSTEGGRGDWRQARASICFVPVNKTHSEPRMDAGGKVYAELPFSRFMIPGNASLTLPEGSATSLQGRDDNNPALHPSPFLLLPTRSSFCAAEQPVESDGSVKRKTSLKSKGQGGIQCDARSKSGRKTSFKGVETLKMDDLPIVKIQIGDGEEKDEEDGQ